MALVYPIIPEVVTSVAAHRHVGGHVHQNLVIATHVGAGTETASATLTVATLRLGTVGIGEAFGQGRLLSEAGSNIS